MTSVLKEPRFNGLGRYADQTANTGIITLIADKCRNALCHRSGDKKQLPDTRFKSARGVNDSAISYHLTYLIMNGAFTMEYSVCCARYNTHLSLGRESHWSTQTGYLETVVPHPFGLSKVITSWIPCNPPKSKSSDEPWQGS